jgi:hypothetical protein
MARAADNDPAKIKWKRRIGRSQTMIFFIKRRS